MYRLNLDGLVSVLATFALANGEGNGDATTLEPPTSTAESMRLDITNATETPANNTSTPEFGSRFGLPNLYKNGNSPAEISDPRYYGHLRNTGSNVRDYPNEAFNPASGGRTSSGWTPNVSNSWNARGNQPSSRLPYGTGLLNAPGYNVQNSNNWIPADSSSAAFQNNYQNAQLPTGNWNNPGLSSLSGPNGGPYGRHHIPPVNANLYSSQTVPTQNAWSGFPSDVLPYNSVPINRGYPNQLNPELLGNQVAWTGGSGRPVTPGLNNIPAQSTWSANPELLGNQGAWGGDLGRIVTPGLNNYPVQSTWSSGQNIPSNNWPGIGTGNSYPAQNVNGFPNQVSPNYPIVNPSQGQWGTTGGSSLYNYPNQNFNGNSGVNFPSSGWSGSGAGVAGSNYPSQSGWGGSPDWSGVANYPVNWRSRGQGPLPQSRSSGAESASDVIYFPEPGSARGKKSSITLLPVLTVAES